MNINIKGTNITVTEAIADYITKRCESFSKFFDPADTAIMCDVEVGKTTNHHKQGEIFRAEIHIVAKDRNLYASSEKEDLYAAIDDVRDEIVSELSSLKDRKVTLVRKGGAKIKAMLKGIFVRD